MPIRSWILRDLVRSATTVNQALQAAGLPHAAWIASSDRGRVRPGGAALFAERFGAARLTGGGEFVSVARAWP